MQQIDDLVYYDSNSDGDNEYDDDIFHDAIQVKDVIEETNDDDDDISGEPINNNFLQLVGQEEGATGLMYEHEGVLYAQYCHYGELYYQPYKIYGNDFNKTEEAINRMAYSGKLWSLYDNTPSFQDNHMLRSEIEYDQKVIKTNQRLAYQGVLYNCKDVGITKAELQETQAPLNPSIRQP